MKIAIGNDHAATELKFVIMDYLKELGHEVINFWNRYLRQLQLSGVR